MSQEELYQSVGGKMIALGADGASASDGYWDFGWKPPELRSEEEHAADHECRAGMSRFSISGKSREGDSKKVLLTEFWKSPQVVSELGYAYPGTHQLTGSCVGAGGGNVVGTLSFIEVVRLGDPEKIILPFYLYTYGRSRFHAGMRGRGEGSFGSAFAKAATQDGFLCNKSHAGLPMPTNSDGLVWGKENEFAWSDGDGRECKGMIPSGRERLVKTTSVLRSADEVRTAITNLYPVTIASMYGFNPEIRKGVLFGVKGPRWGHQMSIQAWWEHPELGELYWCHNQWGLRVHGTCPSGMPGGGVWIPKVDVDWICRTGEAISFSQYQGYPAPEFDVSLAFG